jgi:hypothetical protein
LVDGISATDELSTTKELSAEEMGKMRAEVSFKLEQVFCRCIVMTLSNPKYYDMQGSLATNDED